MDVVVAILTPQVFGVVVEIAGHCRGFLCVEFGTGEVPSTLATSLPTRLLSVEWAMRLRFAGASSFLREPQRCGAKERALVSK